MRAVKNASGYFPDSYSADAADPRSPRTRTLAEDIGRIMQARILNPAWIGGLKEHGYRGAAEISQMTGYCLWMGRHRGDREGLDV